MPLFPDNNIRPVGGRQALPATARVLAAESQHPPSATVARGIKRALDVVLASVAIVLFAPLLAIAAIAIRCEIAGPVIFRQRRNGVNGNPFVIFKFRTMMVLEDGPVVTQARPDDCRLTRVGKWLRRSSIDELPLQCSQG
jgi:lipopolysaccharide/colanic/teichoic acid biosynthesis glycosyltransferase